MLAMILSHYKQDLTLVGKVGGRKGAIRWHHMTLLFSVLVYMENNMGTSTLWAKKSYSGSSH